MIQIHKLALRKKGLTPEVRFREPLGWCPSGDLGSELHSFAEDFKAEKGTSKTLPSLEDQKAPIHGNPSSYKHMAK